MKLRFFISFISCFYLLGAPLAHGGDFVEDSPTVNDSGSSFDPFSDYSEFEEGSEEESDTNFFRNGRFFSLALMGGYESFTDVLGQMYKPDFSYGLSLTYFFDLKFGFQVAYLTSGHTITIVDPRTTTYTGRVDLQHFEFDAKYYFNTQNVTKGLGAINPYLILGFSSYTRTETFTGASAYNRDTEMGFQGGAGLEVPFMKNKMYFGAQGLYNYVSFPDKNTPITVSGSNTNIYRTGDIITFMGLIGLNF